MSPKSFVSRKVRDVVVFVHGPQAPTDEEWEEVLDSYRGKPEQPSFRSLVYTAGGAPSATQRARLREVSQGRARIAVLTASAVARAAGIAVGWFNPQIQIYGLKDIEKALDHLHVPVAQRSELRQALTDLQSALGLVAAHPNG
jgi:hypothetical protein